MSDTTTELELPRLVLDEESLSQGLIADWPIWRNVSMADLASLSRRFWRLDPTRERIRAQQVCAELGVVAPSIDTPVKDLSGGNAQKVVFAKWLYGPARVFLLDEPSAGVDVGAKSDIIQLIRRLASAGQGVLIVSSEFEELLGVCDRILVIRRGQITSERSVVDTDLHELTALASGL